MHLKKTRKLSDSALKTFKQFCQASSLHGFSLICGYIEEPPRPFCKFRKTLRVVGIVTWTSFILMGMIFGSYLMARIWKRYQVSPTITTIESNNYPIGNVAFPAVTVCNVNLAYRPEAKKVVELLKKRAISEDRIWAFIGHLSSLIDFEEVTDEDFIPVSIALQAFNISSEKIMRDLHQPCRSLLKNCEWLGKLTNCRELFRITKSGFGFCCSFNYKALRTHLELNPEDASVNNPILRISGAGEDASLKILLDIQPNMYVAPRRDFYGAEIIIHDSENFPDKSLLTAFAEPSKHISIAVVPSVVSTDESLMALPVELRFCRFGLEKTLQLSAKYTFESCIAECRAFTIFEVCGCVPFFFPPLKMVSTGQFLTQCTLLDIKCLSDNKYYFASLNNKPITTTSESAYYLINGTTACDCLPSCAEQNYAVETFIAHKMDGIFPNENISVSRSNYSLITVYFKDTCCIKYRREIFMSWDGLLASFGGIFGLCLGGSILSVFEVVYFATFKFLEQILTSKSNKIVFKVAEKGEINYYKIKKYQRRKLMAFRRSGNLVW